MRAYTSFIFIILLVLPGCSSLGPGEEESKGDVKPVDLSRYSQAPALLVERWEWIRSAYYGSREPTVERPGTIGRTKTLVFPSADSVVVYRDGEIKQHTTRTEFFAGTSWGVRNDTLVISIAFRDGPVSVYLRAD